MPKNASDIPYIALACDERYAAYLTTTLYSLLYNFLGSQIHIVVLADSISTITKSYIRDSLNEFSGKFVLEFLDIDGDKFSNFPTTERLTKASYMRILLPDLLPTVNKIIYLDCDLIINADISDLWNIPLTAPLAAARVPDLFYAYYCKYQLHIPNAFKLFNSGVLIMNLDYFRKEMISKQLILFLEKTHAWDQDALNYIFSNNYQELNYLWNFCFSASLKLSVFPKSMIDEFLSKKPYIIHFAGAVKPFAASRIYLLSVYYRQFFFFFQKTVFFKLNTIKYGNTFRFSLFVITQRILAFLLPRTILLSLFHKFYTLKFKHDSQISKGV